MGAALDRRCIDCAHSHEADQSAICAPCFGTFAHKNWTPKVTGARADTLILDDPITTAAPPFDQPNPSRSTGMIWTVCGIAIGDRVRGLPEQGLEGLEGVVTSFASTDELRPRIRIGDDPYAYYADRFVKVEEPPTDRYPDDNPKTIHGLAKAQLHLIPGVALVALAGAMQSGLEKYGPTNWRDKPVSRSTYSAALLRHAFAMIDGEDTDPESGHAHLAHIMGCCAIMLDAEAQGTLKDDRPTHGKTGEVIRASTRKIAA